MTDPLPPVPGVHRRACPGCGAATAVTSDTSRTVSTGSLVETREHDCAGCGRTFRLHVPSRRPDPTDSDVGVVGEWLERRARRRRADRVEKELAAIREGRSNG